MKKPRITRKGRDKAKNMSRKQKKFLYQSWEVKKWISKNAFVLTDKTCPIVRTIAQRTNQSYETMWAELKKNNYPKKKLMWVAISNRGMPIPYFSPSKSVAVNTGIYIKGCLQQRLLPFIHKHHSDISFQFVHDLTGFHLSIETIAKMKENLPFSIISPFS